MARIGWIAVVWLVACNEPMLKNAPKPDPGAVAGVAAAVAGAATLASPASAAKRQETKKASDEHNNEGVVVKETVPEDVFDRLDKPSRDAGADAK